MKKKRKVIKGKKNTNNEKQKNITQFFPRDINQATRDNSGKSARESKKVPDAIFKGKKCP